MENILNILNNIWETYNNKISSLFNTDLLRTNIIAIIILILIINFIIIIPLHRLSLRNANKTKKQLVESVDEIIYLLAKSQYKLSQEQSLKYDPCFALMKTMFDSWHFEYLNNIEAIKENVKKVEVLLHQTVITDEKWEKLNKLKRTLKNHIFWSKLLWYEINIATVGIYNITR